MNQNELGRKSEEFVAKYLENFRYWSLIVQASVDGQPFDLISRRKNDVWFLDAKHLEKNKKSFPFSRIEANQITSMQYARIVAEIDKGMGFAIVWENDLKNIYYLSYDMYLKMVFEGKKSVKIETLPKLGDLIICEQ